MDREDRCHALFARIGEGNETIRLYCHRDRGHRDAHRRYLDSSTVFEWYGEDDLVPVRFPLVDYIDEGLNG